MSRETESRHPAPKQSATFASPPTAGPEIIVHNPTAATSSTETQLVILLSESRREAESLREELAAVRKKADSDQRLLNSFLDSSGQLRQSDIPFPASPDLHFFHERLAVAEAALEEAEAQNRIVAANWLQVDRYLSAVQHQAADSRAAFSRILEQDDGLLVLPQQSLPAMGREIPLKEYLSGSGSKPFVKPSTARVPIRRPRALREFTTSFARRRSSLTPIPHHHRHDFVAPRMATIGRTAWTSPSTRRHIRGQRFRDGNLN
ncbi:hypothetical protein B0H10DRAFT_338684 [Mycena sp. CBHHK59/15]|nr:hypothetical protein B0H10DRAFT_338684 [Mycena sp. CBHHK59/15]